MEHDCGTTAGALSLKCPACIAEKKTREWVNALGYFVYLGIVTATSLAKAEAYQRRNQPRSQWLL